MLSFRSPYFCITNVQPGYGILLFSMDSRLRGNDVVLLYRTLASAASIAATVAGLVR
jgi:hypothetical protein